MLTTITKITCDGNPYSQIKSTCSNEIDSADSRRCIGVCGETGITFFPWNDDSAGMGGVLHFHNDDCAVGYLREWLRGKRDEQIAAAAAAASGEYEGYIPAITTIAGGAQ
jgi:hypothetical protein